MSTSTTTTAPGAGSEARRASGDWFAPGTWPHFLARRLGRLVISLVVLVTASFLMIQLIPGDPARASVGATAPAEIVHARQVELGLNLPIWQQYLRFWQGALTGDFGDSFSLRQPVVGIIADRLPATLALAILALAVVMLLSVPIGLTAAAFTRGGRRRGLELGYTSVTGFLAVIPELLLGVALVYLFSVQFNLLPVAGRAGPASYILPVVALSLGGTASMSRIVRTEALTVLEQDYIRTARAKRMPSWRMYLRHALPNLLTSSLTLGGLMLGGLVAGTVLVENIYAWPGLGSTIVQSIKDKDFPLAQAIVIVYGVIVLLVNLIVDIVLVLLDPRSSMKES